MKNQRQIVTVACHAGIGHEQVQRERGQVVGHRLDKGVAVGVHDLQVMAALAAFLGLDGGLGDPAGTVLGVGVGQIQRLVGQLFVVQAVAATAALQMPFGAAQGAVQVALRQGRALLARDAGYWLAAAARTQLGVVGAAKQGAGLLFRVLRLDAGEQMHPVHLQGRADQRSRVELERGGAQPEQGVGLGLQVFGAGLGQGLQTCPGGFGCFVQNGLNDVLQGLLPGAIAWPVLDGQARTALLGGLAQSLQVGQGHIRHALQRFLLGLDDVGHELQKIAHGVAARELAQAHLALGEIAHTVGQLQVGPHLLESVILASLGPDRYRDLWDGKVKWNDPKVREALSNYARMMEYTNRDHAALANMDAAGYVAEGKAAMNVMGDWAAGYYYSQNFKQGEDWDWAPSPGTDGVFIMLSDSFGLPKNAPNRENVIKWLELCASKEGQDAFNPIKGSIPARIDGDRSKYDRYLNAAMDDFASDAIVASVAHGAAISEPWLTRVNDNMAAITTDLDVDKATREFQAAADRYAP